MKDFDDERIRRECESDKYTLNQLMLAQAISLLNRDLELTESKRVYIKLMFMEIVVLLYRRLCNKSKKKSIQLMR